VVLGKLQDLQGHSRRLMSRIVPPCVVAVEAKGELGGASLLAEEAHALGAAVEKRVREFTIARTCARRALSQLGQPSSAILPGASRQPLWPSGVVGSITHCAGYCAAAVAMQAKVVAIGIDAEVHAPVPDGVVDLIAFGEERFRLRRPSHDSTCWDRLLFSAKESVFKAWFPLVGTWLDFDDAVISFAPESATFSARLLVDPPIIAGHPLRYFEGRYLVDRGFVLTAVTLEAELKQS
jgi:4'-phosphopantetheinyl transferase EntD